MKREGESWSGYSDLVATLVRISNIGSTATRQANRGRCGRLNRVVGIRISGFFSIVRDDNIDNGNAYDRDHELCSGHDLSAARCPIVQ